MKAEASAPQDTQPQRLAYTVAECALSVGVSKSHVWRLIWSQELPHIKMGRRVLVTRKALETYLEAQAQ